MRSLVVVFVALTLFGVAAGAVRPVEDTALIGRDDGENPRDVLWIDDVESGENGWTHGDWTAGSGEPRFHVDSYMACGDTGHSWWCGTFDYDADGGYDNSWCEYLELPPTDVSLTGVPEAGRTPAVVCPVWTFCYRHDCEPTYDFAYVQAESLGEWMSLDVFDGYAGWTDVGAYGYPIGSYDNPFRGRFLFTSDGSWSDADGNNTVGGGFACDNIKLYDFYGGTVFFYDDAESGGLCVAGHPDAAGDHWHIAYDLCSSYSKPHSWQCVDVSDTTRLPPLMQNWLDSPWVDLEGAYECRWHAMGHFEIAGYDGDYWYVWVTYDGTEYYVLKANYGDHGSCSGWSASYSDGVLLPAESGWVYDVQIRIAMFTDHNGTIPTGGGCCGIAFDDIWFSGLSPCPVERNSWGSVKVLFR